MCEQLNQSIAYGEKTCNVRVSVRSPTGATIGKVLRISNKSISDTPDGDENLFATVSSQINRWPSLADIWRRAGHVYSEDEASRIRQVIVQFPDTHKIYAYPGNFFYVDCVILHSFYLFSCVYHLYCTYIYLYYNICCSRQGIPYGCAHHT